MAALRHSPHRKAMFIAIGAGALLVLGAMAAAFVLLSGVMTTAATKQHFAPTYRLLDAGLRYSLRTHTQDLQPPPLDRPGVFEQGMACFHLHCVQCHGGPGIEPRAHGRGMLPVPGSLPQAGREWPIEWLYHVTRKGIRMTGMPAWEFRLSDDSLWATAAFLRRLPLLDAGQYQAALARLDSEACTPATGIPDGIPAEELPHIVLRQYACDSCHIIDGLVGARTFVGPPLTGWGRRAYIAGMLPNTPDNLIRWIRDPRDVNPQTLMPDMQVTRAHASVMAAYLMEQR